MHDGPGASVERPRVELLDTHAHLDLPEFEGDLVDVLDRAARIGIGRILCVGTTLESSRACLGLARRYPGRLFASVGIHPNYSSEAGPDDFAEIGALAALPEVVAIGETGLDFHHDYAPRELQEESLRNHVWLVTRGMVKLSCMNEQGDDLLLGLAGPNEIFGEPLTNIDLYEATTIGDSDLLCLPMDEIEGTPHLAITLVKAMSSRMRQSEALIALLGLRRIEERVRGFLELLAQDYGQPCDQGLLLNLRLTHQDIANALSTTRVTVTRVLGLLREEGWLQLDDQRQLVVSHLPRS